MLEGNVLEAGRGTSVVLLMSLLDLPSCPILHRASYHPLPYLNSTRLYHRVRGEVQPFDLPPSSPPFPSPVKGRRPTLHLRSGAGLA
jgi:hypothetical protein